jgi:hypothetical protein
MLPTKVTPFQGDTIKTFSDVALDNDQHVNSNTITNFKNKNKNLDSSS